MKKLYNILVVLLIALFLADVIPSLYGVVSRSADNPGDSISSSADSQPEQIESTASAIWETSSENPVSAISRIEPEHTYSAISSSPSSEVKITSSVSSSPSTSPVSSKVVSSPVTSSKAVSSAKPSSVTSVVSQPASSAPAAVSSVSSAPSGSSSFISEVVRMVNIQRAKAGLDALEESSQLNSAANIRAVEITQTFDHIRPDGKAWYTVLTDNGISYGTCGENIAAGQKTPADVVEAWMNSPGHKANILNSKFRKIGIGYASGGSYGHYWSQLFSN